MSRYGYSNINEPSDHLEAPNVKFNKPNEKRIVLYLNYANWSAKFGIWYMHESVDRYFY
jgi:hypothetical protein